MRLAVLMACVALTACAAGGGGGGVTTALRPADAATSMMSGGALTMHVTSRASSQGEDPLNLLTLSRADGHVMTFEEANHAPNDVRAQSAGGPLAQVMGLFAGTETPVLYHAREGATPFICGPEGPTNIGVYTDATGAVTIVGLKSNFEFEERPDGTASALPYSPDHVCARMHFTKG